jgi:hypothetical protein
VVRPYRCVTEVKQGLKGSSSAMYLKAIPCGVDGLRRISLSVTSERIGKRYSSRVCPAKQDSVGADEGAGDEVGDGVVGADVGDPAVGLGDSLGDVDGWGEGRGSRVGAGLVVGFGVGAGVGLRVGAGVVGASGGVGAGVAGILIEKPWSSRSASNSEAACSHRSSRASLRLLSLATCKFSRNPIVSLLIRFRLRNEAEASSSAAIAISIAWARDPSIAHCRIMAFVSLTFIVE